jgi:alkanesulfonate monooxygenase SsuD/methylene tetrahydromethanopterin reductase-like flavin-dependent oxidoreductase (luciferase family)
MGPALVGADDDAFAERLGRAAAKRGVSPEDMEKRYVDNGLLVGTPDRVAETVATLGEAGVERIYVQWLDLDDLDGMRETMTVVRDG